MSFGFNSKSTSKQGVSFERFCEEVRNEVAMCASLEQQLSIEIQEVHEAEKHLKTLQNATNALMTLYHHRVDAHTHLSGEISKRSEANIELCEKYARIIQHLDQQIANTFSRLSNELSRITANELQPIFVKHEKYRGLLTEISNTARRLIAQVNSMQVHLKTQNPETQQFFSQIEHIKHERQTREHNNFTGLGFVAEKKGNKN